MKIGSSGAGRFPIGISICSIVLASALLSACSDEAEAPVSDRPANDEVDAGGPAPGDTGGESGNGTPDPEDAAGGTAGQGGVGGVNSGGSGARPVGDGPGGVGNSGAGSQGDGGSSPLPVENGGAGNAGPARGGSGGSAGGDPGGSGGEESGNAGSSGSGTGGNVSTGGSGGTGGSGSGGGGAGGGGAGSGGSSSGGTGATGISTTEFGVMHSGFLDGTSNHWEQGRDVVFDSQGNMIVVGGTSSADFLPVLNGAASFDPTLGTGAIGTETGDGGDTDVFVVKLAPDGSLLWGTYVGGPNYDRAYAVEIASDDSIIFAGRAGNGFPTTPGAMQPAYSGDSVPSAVYGQQDGFVAKLSADGTTLVWSTFVGGTGPGFVRDIALDSADRVYFAGSGFADDLPIDPEVDGPQPNVVGSYDSYLGQISADGASFLFGTFIGGNEPALYSSNPSIRVATNGDVYFTSYDYAGVPCVAATPGAYQSSPAGGTDLLYVRLGAGLTTADCSYFGGSADEDLETHTLAIAASGNAVLSGRTSSSDLPTTAGSWLPSIGGGQDGFIAVLTADARSLLAATYVGGSGNEEVEGIGIASNGDILFAGFTASANFPLTGTTLRGSLGGTDGFVGRIPSDLAAATFLTYFGGSGADSFRALAVSNTGDVGLTGVTGSTDYPRASAFDATLNNDNASADQAAAYLRLSEVGN
jgi:hypothetical protein